MTRKSIVGRLDPSKFCAYIIFLLDDKSHNDKKRITPTRIQRFCENKDNQKTIKEIIKDSQNKDISNREYNAFFKVPCTPEMIDKEFLDKKSFPKTLVTRIGKIKHSAKDKTAKTVKEEMSYASIINDFHYIIDNEYDSIPQPKLSDQYLQDFENSLVHTLSETSEDRTLISDSSSLIDFKIQRYKYYFKNFDEMNNEKRYLFFKNLFDYSNTEEPNDLVTNSNEIDNMFIPIMKETNSGLNIALRVCYKKKDNAIGIDDMVKLKTKLVITQNIDALRIERDSKMSLEDISDYDIILDFKDNHFSSDVPVKGHMLVKDYTQLENYIKESIEDYSNLLQDQLKSDMNDYLQYKFYTKESEKSICPYFIYYDEGNKALFTAKNTEHFGSGKVKEGDTR